MSALFDPIIDRRNLGDVKYDRSTLERLAGVSLPEEIYPMWVADSDFLPPACLREALQRRIDHGILGYPAVPPAFAQAAAWWQRTRFAWEADPDWVVPLPGTIAGLNIAVRAMTAPGDGVILQTPVYDPFYRTVEQAGRRIATNPLLCREGRYEMDFEGLEALMRDPSNRLLVLCSPHNPVSRVWTEAELRRLGDLCLAHGVAVVSDEVHGDLVYPPHVHHPLLSLSPDYAAQFVFLSSPGKTFNIPGLRATYAIIPSPALRSAFQKMQEVLSLAEFNTLGLLALTAAYSPEGAAWADALVAYLAGNAALTAERLPGGITMTPMEGTFLA